MAIDVAGDLAGALDSEGEAAIQDTVYGMMKGKTVIAIAHPLSSIAHMDRILLMNQRRIVKQGSHDALLAGNTLYGQFWSRRSGGFLNPEATE